MKDPTQDYNRFYSPNRKTISKSYSVYERQQVANRRNNIKSEPQQSELDEAIQMSKAVKRDNIQPKSKDIDLKDIYAKIKEQKENPAPASIDDHLQNRKDLDGSLNDARESSESPVEKSIKEQAKPLEASSSDISDEDLQKRIERANEINKNPKVKQLDTSASSEDILSAVLGDLL